MIDGPIFSNAWWYHIVETYDFSIVVAWGILKAIAVLDHTNQTNQILDTFRKIIFGSGSKILCRRAGDNGPPTPPPGGQGDDREGGR